MLGCCDMTEDVESGATSKTKTKKKTTKNPNICKLIDQNNCRTYFMTWEWEDCMYNLNTKKCKLIQ